MSRENSYIEQQIQQLKDFIKSRRDSREVTRALAVKLALEGYTYRSIVEALGISYSFVSKWKKAFQKSGIDGLKLAHKGSKSYLSQAEKNEIASWLSQQKSWKVSDLECYLAEQYNIVFKSKQSYYQLLKEARIEEQKS
jgi:transposase